MFANNHITDIENILPLEEGDKVISVIPVEFTFQEQPESRLLFVTNKGMVRHNYLSEFVEMKQSNQIAIKIKENDNLANVLLCQNKDEITIDTSKGKSTKFNIDNIRINHDRNNAGINYINIGKDDNIKSIRNHQNEN